MLSPVTTVQVHYNTDYFSQNTHNRLPIAHLWEWGMGCLLWDHSMIRCFVFVAATLSALQWWLHQMETFSVLLAICAGNSPVNSSHKGQWCGSLMVSLIRTWINHSINNGEAGDLRRYRTHYDVIVMIMLDNVVMRHCCMSHNTWGLIQYKDCLTSIGISIVMMR